MIALLGCVGLMTGRAQEQSYVFEPLAGALASVGSADGGGSAARFADPRGIATDRDGNIYVADTGNATVRKITPAGVVTTLAGTPGLAGNKDGVGPDARFYGPTALAVDGSGNIFVADGTNRVIRKITPAGVVTTYAGAVDPTGKTTGTVFAADFVIPVAVAFDPAGNLYVADGNREGGSAHWYYGNAIWRITPAGVVTIFAGTPGVSGSDDGVGAAATFRQLSAMTSDSTGNLYLTDGDTVRKVTPAGVVSTVAGTDGRGGYGDSVGAEARFYGPTGIAVDAAGNLYVCDTGNGLIRKISPNGTVGTFAGSGAGNGSADGIGRAVSFTGLRAIAIDPAGTFYIADADNTVRKMTADAAVTTLAGSATSTGSRDGFGSDAAFLNPTAVAVDPAGNAFVTDSDNYTIRKVTPAGIVSTIAGMAGMAGSADGVGAAARFNEPVGIAIDSHGDLFVADGLNRTVRKIAPDGTVSTFAGLAGVFESIDGPGAVARFQFPHGVAVDPSDNVYISDLRTIRKITPAGEVSTLAGSPDFFGTEDGTGAAARFDDMSEPTVDSAGNVYVTDKLGIRKITPGGVVTTTMPSEDAGWITINAPINRYFAHGTVGQYTPIETITLTFSPAPYPDWNARDGAGNLIVLDRLNAGLLIGHRADAISRLVNLSCRATTGADAKTLIEGFVVSGGTKNILARGIGPSLVRLGVEHPLPAAQITLYSGPAAVATNSGWSTGNDAVEITAVSKRVGAFALDAGTADAAVLATVEDGVHTLHVTGSAPGVALAEIYDADLAASSARLVNVSARIAVGTANELGIAGFVIAGSASKTVLIRGIGPGLEAMGVGGVLAAPQLRLYSGGSLIAENIGWGAGRFAAQVPGVSTQVGAFPLPANSRDDAILVTLRPGAYTAQLSGVDSGTGVALVEVYEVQ